MNILDFSKDGIKAMCSIGMMNKKSPFHWDVCKELSAGKTIRQVADLFDVTDDTIYKIKYRKCREC